MAAMDQRNIVACGGCGGLGENDLKGPPPTIERLINPRENLSPTAHAMKILELFNLDPEKVTSLQSSDRGLSIVPGSNGGWVSAKSIKTPVRLKDTDYVLHVQSDQGSEVKQSYRVFGKLSRAAVAFSQEVSQEEQGAVHYTDNESHPSPLMLASEHRFAVVFKGSMPDSELPLLLHESPLRNRTNP